MKKMLSVFILGIFTLSGISQHSIVLKSGEKIKGIILKINNDTLYYAVAQKAASMHMAKVSSLFFDEYVPYDGKLLQNNPEQVVKSGDYTISYNLKDRKMTTIPTISKGNEEKGKVVVNIVVNRNGNVIQAEPGVSGSTTSSEYLLTKAKFAAQSAKFEPTKTGPVEVKGTITINY